MSIVLVPIRFFTQESVGHYTEDNKPLQDISFNLELLKQAIEAIAPTSINPTISNIQVGDVIAWNGSTWVNSGAPASTSFVAAAINDLIDSSVTWTGAHRGVYSSVSSSSGTITLDLNTSNNFTTTLTENTTLGAPTNVVAGQTGILSVTQHASSPKTLGFNTFWKFPGGIVPTMTATASAVDMYSYTIDPTGTFGAISYIQDIR